MRLRATVKRGLIALLLSLGVPGLGQIYNGQLIKAILLFTSIPVFLAISAVLGLLHTYKGLIVHIASVSCLYLAVGIDAMLTAVGLTKSNRIPKHGWHSYVLAAALLSVSTLVFVADLIPDELPGVHAYKVPFDSMAPTVTSGDRIIADMRYYKKHLPNRGDVVVLKTPPFDALTIKRVIAVGGDTIEGSPETTIVNGKVIREPYLRPVSHGDNLIAESSAEFGPMFIPANQLFVMGDNRNHSFDSRYPGFGLVGIERIRARPLYIYSSNDRARIGMAIR